MAKRAEGLRYTAAKRLEARGKERGRGGGATEGRGRRQSYGNGEVDRVSWERIREPPLAYSQFPHSAEAEVCPCFTFCMIEASEQPVYGMYCLNVKTRLTGSSTVTLCCIN